MSSSTPPPVDDKYCSIIAQPTRFTTTEKEILFALFQQHEDVIDIKCRKSTRPKKRVMNVRECWQKIVEEYNKNPNITTPRNMKQVQKFWLNARLRKKYPNSNISASTESVKIESEIHQPSDRNSITKVEYEVIEAEFPSSVDENPEDEADHYLDNISAEKLTLSDLLEFKNTQTTPQPTEHTTEKIPLASPIHHRSPQIKKVTVGEGGNGGGVGGGDRRTTESHYHHHHSSCSNHCINETIEDRLNYFKVREAELKCQEQEIRLQQKKLELVKARTELRNMKELHSLQVEEMKIKIRLLNEEEKNKKNKNNN